MSKSAAVFFLLALVSGITHLMVAQELVITLPLIACGIFAAFFVLALIVGRKFKFDPVLR
ncbi:PA3371 family protein [Pseudomonas vancouverensis]|uniref:PA3371 family protein n=1 Tax=Pseudomonas vancouverensis TaxID=95300 RepID=UPI003D08481E